MYYEICSQYDKKTYFEIRDIQIILYGKPDYNNCFYKHR